MTKREEQQRGMLLAASLILAWFADAAPPGLFRSGVFVAVGALFTAVWVPWGKPERDD